MAIVYHGDENDSDLRFIPLIAEDFLSGLNLIDMAHLRRSSMFTLKHSSFFGYPCLPGPRSLVGFMKRDTPFPSSVTARRMAFIARAEQLFKAWQFDTDLGPSKEKPILNITPHGDVYPCAASEDLPLVTQMDYASDGIALDFTTVPWPTFYGDLKSDSAVIEGAVSTGNFDYIPPAPGYLFNKVKYFKTYFGSNKVVAVVGYYYAIAPTTLNIFIQRWVLELHHAGTYVMGQDISTAAYFTLQREHHTLYAGGGTPSVDYFPVFADPYLAGLDPFSPLENPVSYPVGIGLAGAPENHSLERMVGYTADGYRATHSQSFLTFVDDVSPFVEDAYALLSYSVDDALSSYLEVSESNYIEAASEFSSVLGLVDIKELAVWVLKRRGKMTFLDLMDLFSSATLLYRFGISPTIGDAQEASRLSQSVAGRVQNLQTPKVVRGKFVIPSHDLLPSDTRVVIRSKLTVSLDCDTLLPWILTADQFGVLPSMSRIWDIIPFSFLLDYIVDIGSGLSAVDRSLLAVAYNVHDSLHSVKIVRSLPSEQVRRYGLSSQGPVEYQYYERLRLLSLPPVMPGRLAPLFQSHGPDYFVGGSLFWALLRAL